MHFTFFRTELVNLKPSTGFRFNGHGHAVISARAYSIRQRLDIQLKFKTSEETGLLFLLGKDNTFIDLELRNGKVLYQVKCFVHFSHAGLHRY